MTDLVAEIVQRLFMETNLSIRSTEWQGGASSLTESDVYQSGAAILAPKPTFAADPPRGST